MTFQFRVSKVRFPERFSKVPEPRAHDLSDVEKDSLEAHNLERGESTLSLLLLRLRADRL